MAASSSTTQMFEVRVDPEVMSRKILHGFLPLTDARVLLREEGDYLLRLVDYQGQFICVLSALHIGEVLTVCVSRRDKMYFFDPSHKVCFHSSESSNTCSIHL
ncbi:unnamed protein product [Gongylonema pulchrum]|uniref:SH2 domain-containing protein n=1 Tax=Gongylonema pulchrum TaxID=637853 RepID=A0A183D282_9BILA|nr:unnamed protein product [Gongylonema pulchrum]